MYSVLSMQIHFYNHKKAVGIIFTSQMRKLKLSEVDRLTQGTGKLSKGARIWIQVCLTLKPKDFILLYFIHF